MMAESQVRAAHAAQSVPWLNRAVEFETAGKAVLGLSSIAKSSLPDGDDASQFSSIGTCASKDLFKEFLIRSRG